MAIQYVGGQTFFAQTGSVTFNLTGGIASTPATDDLVLISYAEASSGDVSLASAITTSGYTQVAELFANDSNDANLAVFYKVMGATPNTTVSAKTAASSQNGAACVVHVFRGVDTTTPLDVTSTTATNFDTGNTNPAAITPATSGNVIIPFGCYAEGNVARSYTAPSYLSNFRQTNRVGTTYGIVTGSGHVTGQPAGVSYDPATWLASNDSTSYSWCAVTLALRPAPPPAINGSATFTGTGSFSTAGARQRVSSSSFSGIGSTAFTGTRNRQASLTLSGVGSFSASSVKAKVAVASLLGIASVDALGARSSSVSTSFLGVGSLDALGGLLRASTASLGGSSTLLGAGFKTKAASLSLTGSGSLSTLVLKRKNAIFTGFNSEATRTTNLGDVRVTEDGNIRVTFPLVYNEAESTLVASGDKTQFNALAYVKQNGIWKRMTPNAKHSGIWQEAQRMYKKISDNWKRIY